MIGGVSDSDIARAFPWVPRFRSVLSEVQPQPFPGPHILVGSDYSGFHSNSDYLVYAFLLVDADGSPEWPRLRKEVRDCYLSDGRRMSFKNMNDGQRRRALVPFLHVADAFSGICCAVVVHKELSLMSSSPNSLNLWRTLHGLEGKWDVSAFEMMARIVHFYCLLVSAVSKPFQNVTWITDQDEIVANDDRLTDVMMLASRMIGSYMSHTLGEFAMNSTGVDTGDRGFEDFVAIPDLVAGALSEIVTVWSQEPSWGSRQEGTLLFLPDGLTKKSNLITSWFSCHSSSLKRCAILIDRADEHNFLVQQLDLRCSSAS